MIKVLNIRNYRSLRDVCFELAPLTVITGANGSGKSNVFRVLALLKAAANGRFAETLAAEGGMPGALFAGPEHLNHAQAREGIVEGTPRKKRIELSLGVDFNGLRFELVAGLPPQQSHEESFFTHDPDIKTETLWRGKRTPKSTLLARKAAIVPLESGLQSLASQESMLWQLSHQVLLPELTEMRTQLATMRLYHGFSSEAHSVIRQARIGFRSDYLADDGGNLTSVLANIQMIGDLPAFDDAISRAFEGAKVRIERDAEGRFHLRWHQFGLLRPLSAAELSDGTLRFLCLLAALHAPRDSAVLAFNEPELSLYPELLPELARQFRLAARQSQVIVVSHSRVLVQALEDFGDAHMVGLKREFGASIVEGQGILNRPSF